MQPITITPADRKRFFNEIPTYEERNFTVTEEGQERASLARIELVMHHFLQSLSLSMQERYDLVKEAHSWFEQYGYRFQKEPLFPFIVEGEAINVPANVIIHSTVLDDMMSENAEETPTISLPTRFTPQEFATYLHLLSTQTKFETLEQWLKLRAVADRILYSASFFERMDILTPRFLNTLEELEQMLFALKYDIDSTTANGYISRYLNSYIRSSLKTKPIEAICEELKTVKDHLSNYAITLELEAPRSVADLLSLENAIPNVTELHVKIIGTRTFPSVWPNTLSALKLSPNDMEQIIEIPHNTLANLITLILINVELYDYSTLDNRERLQTLHLENLCLVHRVPTGCISLQKFLAKKCPIKDFSALDNLPHLKECTLTSLVFLTRAPTGCQSLQLFSAIFCPINDFSGLNDLPNLEYCQLEQLDSLTSFPTGCRHLQNIRISNCRALTNVTGFHNLEHLTSYSLDYVPLLTTVPIGCPNLKTVFIGSCNQLENFSGLNNLPHLTTCKLWNLSLITTAPQNCRNLKTFEALRCPKLENFSGLNNLSNLTSCKLEDLPLITAMPNSWPALKSLTVHNCSNLIDSSGLHASNKPQVHSFVDTPIRDWKPNLKEVYLKSLFPEQKEEDEKTVCEMISLLSEKCNWDPLLKRSLQRRNDFTNWGDEQSTLSSPVAMSPELHDYYMLLTRGIYTTLSQEGFIEKLGEILNTIREPK